MNRIEEIVGLLGTDEMLALNKDLPPLMEFNVMMLYLVELSGDLRNAKVELSNIPNQETNSNYRAHLICVAKVKQRLLELFGSAANAAGSISAGKNLSAGTLNMSSQPNERE